jgi:hypothetical protein
MRVLNLKHYNTDRRGNNFLSLIWLFGYCIMITEYRYSVRLFVLRKERKKNNKATGKYSYFTSISVQYKYPGGKNFLFLFLIRFMKILPVHEWSGAEGICHSPRWGCSSAHGCYLSSAQRIKKRNNNSNMYGTGTRLPNVANTNSKEIENCLLPVPIYEPKTR